MDSPKPVLIGRRFSWLSGSDFNETSQFGEDGLIGAVFDRIGEANKWCFEVGAADGLYLSNTKRLRDKGWSAVLIESGKDHFDSLCRFENGRVRCIHEHIEPSSLDRILSECGAPTDMDFGVIDIDGQDCHAWRGMQEYKPRVMLVEFCLDQKDFEPAIGATKGQAGFGVIEEIGREKGYLLVARTYVNALFVLEDVRC